MLHPYRTQLSNGLTVLVEHAPQSDVVAIVTYVRAGYFDESDEVVGISHVVEHMFFKGTPRFGVGEIAKATKAAGGYLNAHTIYDHTSYYTVLPARTFAQGLGIQADAYAHSLIDEGELTRELEVIIQEAKRKADNPAAVATETLYEVLHDSHRIRRWRIGREDELRRLTREAVHGFYRNFYQPENTIVAIAGGVPVDVAVREVEARYGKLPTARVQRSTGPRENGTQGFQYRELTGDVQQSQLRLGWRGVSWFHPAAPALDLAATALAAGRASRLYRAVRERELATSVAAYNYTLPDIGVFTVHLETEPASALEALRATWSEVASLRERPLPEHELLRAKRLYEARWLRGLETMEGRANFLAAWEALGGWERGAAYLDAVLAVTPDDLRSAAVSQLDPERAALLLYRPADAHRPEMSAELLRRELELRPPAVPPTDEPTRRPRATTATPTFEKEVAGVRVYRTAQGMPLLVRRRRGLGFAYLGVYSGAGATSDPADRAGLTLLLARTALKGTASRSAEEIAGEAERLGGSIGAAPAADALGWSIAVPLAAAPEAFDLLADVAQRPVFPPESLEIERAIALADLTALRDDMFSYPIRLMQQAAFAPHPYATPTLGTEAGLRSVARSDVIEAHDSRMRRGAAVAAIVADEDADVLAALAAGVFSESGVGATGTIGAPGWAGGVTEVEEREKAQTALALAVPGPGRRHHDRYAVELLARVASGLGGRFFEELRDRRSLAYTVHAFATTRPLAGLFGTYIATSPEREDEARSGVLAELERLRSEPPSAEELERAREYALGTELIRRESGSALLSEMIDAWLFGELEELARYEAAMRGVTTTDLERVTAEYIRPELAACGIVRGKAAR